MESYKISPEAIYKALVSENSIGDFSRKIQDAIPPEKAREVERLFREFEMARDDLNDLRAALQLPTWSKVQSGRRLPRRASVSHVEGGSEKKRRVRKPKAK
jgi:hypothetical protein